MAEPRASTPGQAPIDSRADGSRCRCLRWKGMFIDAEPDPLVPSTRDGLYWCLHTQNCLGPDGKVAEARRCGPGRACFEPLAAG